MSETTNNYKLMGFFEALTLIFVVAKIAGYVSWSWFWVFSPVILHIGIVIFVIVVILVIGLIGAIFK